MTVETGTATFASGIMTLAATATSRDLAIPKGLVGGAFSQKPVSKSYKYSNSATKLTIKGVAYNITYWPRLQQIAQSFAFSGPNGAGCAVSATGYIQ